MLTKKQFIEAVNDIKNNYEYINKQEYELGLYLTEHSLLDSYIKTLELSMNCEISEKYGGPISWWIYDTQCGKDKPNIFIKSKNTKKEIKLEIKTVENLYNYIIEYESKK